MSGNEGPTELGTAAPTRAPLATLVRVTGRRWTVEEAFQTSKGQTGLDEHQCRTWTSWYRWTTLVLLAHALLTIVTVTARSKPAPTGLIPCTHLLRGRSAHGF